MSWHRPLDDLSTETYTGCRRIPSTCAYAGIMLIPWRSRSWYTPLKATSFTMATLRNSSKSRALRSCPSVGAARYVASCQGADEADAGGQIGPRRSPSAAPDGEQRDDPLWPYRKHPGGPGEKCRKNRRGTSIAALPLYFYHFCNCFSLRLYKRSNAADAASFRLEPAICFGWKKIHC